MAKGAYIYQQIELTTAEWAVNETVYPPSVWLFERLENGKFNMKLSDGVHKFPELAAVLQDVVVETVKEDDDTYILRFTTARGVFDTPNLRGQDVRVKVKTNTSSTYVLTITTVAGSFDTPTQKGGGLAEAPTLESEPTPETLTYIDNTGVEVAFALGDEVRYYNTEEEEFIFRRGLGCSCGVHAYSRLASRDRDRPADGLLIYAPANGSLRQLSLHAPDTSLPYGGLPSIY